MYVWYQQLIALRKQGLAEGWLAQNRMTTGHDPERDLFSLHFDCGDGGHVSVQARLTGTSRRDTETITADLDGMLLLSSETDPIIEQGRVALHPNHVVISQFARPRGGT